MFALPADGTTAVIYKPKRGKYLAMAQPLSEASLTSFIDDALSGSGTYVALPKDEL